MKQNIIKALTAAMAAAIVVCSFAGCGNNGGKPADSSPASEASVQSSAESTASASGESSTESADGSKDESKDESSEQSKTESSEESADESSEESAESAEPSEGESSEESEAETQPFEESVEESSEEPSIEVSTLTAGEVVGYWEYNSESGYMLLNVMSDGTLSVSDGSDEPPMSGFWSLDTEGIQISFGGTTGKLAYADDTLVDTEDSSFVFTRSSGETQTSAVSFDPVGTWTYDVGSAYMSMRINANGTVTLSLKDGSEYEGTWSYSGSESISISVAGGTAEYAYQNGMLVVTDGDNEGQYFSKTAD